MGNCCHKKRKRNTLLKKIKEEDEEQNDESDSNAMLIKLTFEDFIPIKLLGRGSFGQVILARLKANNKLYAMKILDKTLLKNRHQELHTQTERDLMVKVKCPFIVNIKTAFQDNKYLYIVSDFMQGGDLFYHMHEARKFDFELTQFYSAEILLALEYLHKKDMVYRDLKPENILLDSKGHIKLTDFGLSKILSSSNDKAFTICGTQQYLAPEMFMNKGYSKNVDWWALGCLIYEMLTGKLPFPIKRDSKISFDLYQKKIQFPRYMNEDARDLITKMLILDPKKRLGYGKDDVVKIKNHPFFEEINWDDIWNRRIIPPFEPDLQNELDLKYFDSQFTDEPLESFVNNPRSREVSYEYKNFTYVTDSVKNDLLTIPKELTDADKEN
jgi:serine/threonine protein kinase